MELNSIRHASRSRLPAPGRLHLLRHTWCPSLVLILPRPRESSSMSTRVSAVPAVFYMLIHPHSHCFPCVASRSKSSLPNPGTSCVSYLLIRSSDLLFYSMGTLLLAGPETEVRLQPCRSGSDRGSVHNYLLYIFMSSVDSGNTLREMGYISVFSKQHFLHCIRGDLV